jgi:hypothetical protein
MMPLLIVTYILSQLDRALAHRTRFRRIAVSAYDEVIIRQFH